MIRSGAGRPARRGAGRPAVPRGQGQPRISAHTQSKARRQLQPAQSTEAGHRNLGAPTLVRCWYWSGAGAHGVFKAAAMCVLDP